jgi:long-chain fatty acid transport protein
MLSYLKRGLLTIVFIVMPFFSGAGGFQINTQAQKAMSMGGSVTGLALDGSIAFYNPAGLSFLDSNFVNAGFSLILPKTSFLGAYKGSESMSSRLYSPFYVYGSYKLKGKWTAGLSVNTPYGLGTKWEDNWSGRFVSRQAKLSTIYFQPTIAFKFNDHISLGAGPVYVSGGAKIQRALPYTDGVHGDAGVELKGRGNGFGYNLGIFLESRKMSLGLNYRSKAKVDIKNGDASFSNIPSSLILNNTFPTSTSFNSTITLPSVFSLGVGYHPVEKVEINLDFNFTSWSVYDSLNFDFPDYPSINNENARKYKDVFALRLGVQYTMNYKLALRAGMAYDESPVKDGYLNPELPDANKVVMSCGFTYRIKKHLSAEGSFMFENAKERKESENLENNFNGTYKSYLYIIGLGIQYVF